MLPDGLYRTLMFAMAEDWETGGVVAEICSDWADAPDTALHRPAMISPTAKERNFRLVMSFPVKRAQEDFDSSLSIKSKCGRRRSD